MNVINDNTEARAFCMGFWFGLYLGGLIGLVMVIFALYLRG
jgi:hypothetical protein